MGTVQKWRIVVWGGLLGFLAVLWGWLRAVLTSRAARAADEKLGKEKERIATLDNQGIADDLARRAKKESEG